MTHPEHVPPSPVVVGDHPDWIRYRDRAASIAQQIRGRPMRALTLEGYDRSVILAALDLVGLTAATAEIGRLREALPDMLTAGARSIGGTMRSENHMVRAAECWRAMWAARDGIVEPKPAALDPNPTSKGGGR